MLLDVPVLRTCGCNGPYEFLKPHSKVWRWQGSYDNLLQALKIEANMDLITRRSQRLRWILRDPYLRRTEDASGYLIYVPLDLQIHQKLDKTLSLATSSKAWKATRISRSRRLNDDGQQAFIFHRANAPLTRWNQPSILSSLMFWRMGPQDSQKHRTWDNS